MEYQKAMHLLDNTPNQLSKFNTKNWVEINDESHGVCDIVSQIKFKTSMLRSRLYDYNDAYISVSGTITVVEIAFTDCRSEKNNTQTDNDNRI